MAQQDYENGLKVRTEVMGEAFVKRAQDNTVAFTQPLQDWINEHAWGQHGNVKEFCHVNTAL
jgi:4-carboxymuconolactone decarboxylase